MPTFLSFFPVPKFLSMPVFGIDISDASIKYLQLLDDKGKITLGVYGEEPLPQGIVASGGKIENPIKLSEILSRIAKKYSIEHAALALPEEQAYLVELKAPYMKESQLRGSLELSLEEHIPLPPSEIVFDYEILERPKTPKDTYTLAVAALPAGLVTSYAQVCKQSSVHALSFEIEAHALARAIISKKEEGSYMIVDLGKTRTGIAIGDRDGVAFSTTVALGGDALSKALVKELAISYEAAEKIKVERGFLNIAGNEKAYEALFPALSALKDEINKHYGFWQTHADSFGVKRKPVLSIFITGGQANMPGLAAYLGAGIEVTVVNANPWVNVPLASPETGMSSSAALRFATAIGLALRHITL